MVPHMLTQRSPPGFGLEDFDVRIRAFIEVSMSKYEIDKKKEDIQKGLYKLYDKMDFDLVVVYPGSHTLPEMLKNKIGKTPRIIICNLEREDSPIHVIRNYLISHNLLLQNYTYKNYFNVN